MFTKEVLDEVFLYEPCSGIFTWKFRGDQRSQWNSRCAGKTAGCIRKADGYIILTVNGIQTYGQVVAWLMSGNPIPEGYFIDHIDGDPSNNKLENLRLVSKQESVYNTKARDSQNNTSRYKGVHKVRSGKFTAQITSNYKCVSLGTYSSEEEAAEVYNWTARELQGDYARLNDCSIKPPEDAIAEKVRCSKYC